MNCGELVLLEKNILVYCDNKCTVDGLRSGISKNVFSQACIRNITHFVVIHDFQVRAVHIDGISNHISDCLSRWNLDPKFREEFHRLTKDIQMLEVSLFDTNFVDLY